MLDLGPRPLLGYIANPLDRAADRRDDGSLAALDAEAGAYLVGGELVVLRKASEPDALFSLTEARGLAPIRETVFLGLQSGVPRYGAAIDQSAAEALKSQPGYLVIDLRSIAIQGLVAPEHVAALAEAKAMLTWHARHRFCANCGTPTVATNAGWRRDCPNCKTQHFPRTDPVVIMLAIDGERCLLGRQSRFGAGMWSCLAGFVEPGETIEQAVRRETLEEAGIPCGTVTYFASQPWPFPMSLMIGCHAQALASDIKVDRSELEDARWFSREEATAMLRRQHPGGLTTPPPFAIAHHIIRAWVEGTSAA
jgi:NAD+ diphosphatase